MLDKRIVPLLKEGNTLFKNVSPTVRETWRIVSVIEAPTLNKGRLFLIGRLVSLKFTEERDIVSEVDLVAEYKEWSSADYFPLEASAASPGPSSAEDVDKK